jgi:hypothetical protein
MRRRILHFAAVLSCCFVVFGVLAQPSFGLVNTSDHFSYNQVPVNDPGWNFVGQMSNGTGVYLGDGWVLTPWHVYRHQAEEAYIELDQQYDEVPGTSKRILFDANTDADLVMFRINGNPELYPGNGSGHVEVQIRPTAVNNELATIIGTGFGRDGDLQTWNFGGQTYTGFDVSDTRVKQWGTNHVAVYPEPITPEGGYGTTHALWSLFDDWPVRSDETQPVDKDSGGAAFIKRSGSWELAGMVIAMAASQGYPHDDLPLAEHAVYDTGALYADLSKYENQISAIRLTPLPGDADWNGRVDLVDFSLLRQSFGQSGPGLRADFDNSGLVDDADLTILQTNFGVISGNGLTFPGGAPVFTPVLAPEPATVSVLICSAPLLLKSRKRRRSA